MENKPENKIEISFENQSGMSKKEELFWIRFALIFAFAMGLLSLLVPIFLILFWS